MKGKLLLKAIHISDLIDIYFRTHFNINLKAKALEKSQNMIPLSQLENTIGKSLDILPLTSVDAIDTKH